MKAWYSILLEPNNGNLGICNLCGQTVTNILCQIKLLYPSEGDFKLHTNFKSLQKKGRNLKRKTLHERISIGLT